MRRWLVFAVLAGGPGFAVDASQNTSDPRALSALKEMQAAYAAVEAFHVKVQWTAKYSGAMSADDFPLPGPETVEIRMLRPNRFFLSASSRRRPEKSSSYLIVSDGSSLWHWRSWTNTYSQTRAPASVNRLSAALPKDVIGSGDGSTWTVDDIFEWDVLADEAPPPLEAVAAAGGRFTFTGPEKLGNAPVNVVRMISPPGLIPLLVEQRFYVDLDTGLVRGLGTSARGKNPENDRDFTVELLGRYDVFTTRPAFGDADFTFTPPRGARQAAIDR